jgi:hypothetical protein
MNAQGRSIVVSDERVAEGTLGNFNFFRTAATGATGGDVAATAFPFYPPPGETLFRIFRLPPPDPNAPPEALADISKEFFAGAGAAAKVDTSRHPLMHTTPTTDYIVLLSGWVSLLLDEGDPIALEPFDAVVQRATNHAWVVTGAEPATLVAVMVGQGAR